MDMTDTARGSVVVGIDTTEESRPALAYAVHAALLRRSPLEIVHVVPAESSAQSGREAVGSAVLRAKRLVKGAVPVTGRTVPGSSVDGLVRASARAALLVVGRARRTGSGATTSVADQVAQRSEAPVIIVPPVWATPGRTRRVTVGVDQPGHARLLEEAFQAAALERGEVTILHVWHPGGLEEAALARIGGPDWYPIEECQLRERLEKSVAAAAQRFPGIRHTVEMEPALRAPAETLAEASEWSVLVVVGRRDPAFDGDETVIGSAVSGLLDLALCPVLVVPATTLGPGPASRPTATEEPVGHQA